VDPIWTSTAGSAEMLRVTLSTLSVRRRNRVLTLSVILDYLDYLDLKYLIKSRGVQRVQIGQI